MNKFKKIRGVIVPAISPITADGTIDTVAVKRMISYLSQSGVSAFIQGTTGEALSLSMKERIRFAESATEADRGGQLLYAGISHHSFTDSVELAKQYFNLGVDIAVAHLPNFYPLDDRQITAYFERLADNIPGPLLIYNIPKTVHASIPINVVERLSLHPNIYGIKDSEQDIPRLKTLVDISKNRDDFCHLIGWAPQSVYAISIGSDGIVPSTGNLVPKLYQELYEAALRGDDERAEKLQNDTNTISRIYQRRNILSRSLAILKVMMEYFGLCDSFVLPPLRQCDDEEKEDIIAKVDACKQLNHLKQQIIL